MIPFKNYHYLLTDQKVDEGILHEFPQGKFETLRNQIPVPLRWLNGKATEPDSLEQGGPMEQEHWVLPSALCESCEVTKPLEVPISLSTTALQFCPCFLAQLIKCRSLHENENAVFWES